MAVSKELAIILSGRDTSATAALKGLHGQLGGLPGATNKATSAFSGLVSGLGKIGLAGMGIDALANGVRGLGDAIGLGLNVEMENVRAQFMAFTKDAGKTDEILAQIRAEADKTPFAFQEMSKAVAGLMPAAKQANEPLMSLVKTAEILAASNPAQGLEGAAFALREAVSGDFTSVIERFNLPRSMINDLKAQGIPALEAVRQAMLSMGFDMDLVSNLSKTASGRWSTFMDTIDGIKKSVSEPLFKILSESLVGLQAVFDTNKEAIAGWAATIGAGIGNTVQGAADAIGNIISIVDSLVTAFQTDSGAMGVVLDGIRRMFGDTVANAIEPFIRGFMAIIPGLKDLWQAFSVNIGNIVTMARKAFTGDIAGALDAFDQQMTGFGPGLMDQLGTWAQMFVDWVAPMIPPLLKKLGDLLTQVGGWLLDTALPGIVGKLKEWAMALVAWVQPMIGPLLDKAGELAGALLGWMGRQVGPLLARLAEWGRQLWAWIEPMIPPMLVEAGKLATRLIDWIGAEGPGLAETFIREWVPAVLGWLVDAGKAIIPKLVEFAAAITVWVYTEGIPRIVTAAKSIGDELVKGIWDGISKLGGWLQSQLGAWIETNISAPVRRALGIHSASTLFHSFGKQTVQGLADGIDDTTPVLEMSVSSIWRMLTAGAESVATIVQDIATEVQSIVPVVDVSVSSIWQMMTSGAESVATIAEGITTMVDGVTTDVVVGTTRMVEGMITMVEGVTTQMDAVTTRMVQGITTAVQGVTTQVQAVITQAAALSAITVAPGGANWVSPGCGSNEEDAEARREAWVAGGSVDYNAMRDAGVPGFARGGIVPGPWGRPALAIVHGGETVTPAGRAGGVTQVINMQGNYVGFDRSSLEELARQLKPHLDSLVRL